MCKKRHAAFCISCLLSLPESWQGLLSPIQNISLHCWLVMAGRESHEQPHFVFSSNSVLLSWKASFDRMTNIHKDENRWSSWNLFKFQYQCCTDTCECSGLTRTFLESPRRIGGPEVFIFTPPSPIPGLLLRSVVEFALTCCCCKGWFIVEGTERHCKKEYEMS